jgi:hypothetical protein
MSGFATCILTIGTCCSQTGISNALLKTASILAGGVRSAIRAQELRETTAENPFGAYVNAVSSRSD